MYNVMKLKWGSRADRIPVIIKKISLILTLRQIL